MKGKLDPSERQRLIEEGTFGAIFHSTGILGKLLKTDAFCMQGRI